MSLYPILANNYTQSSLCLGFRSSTYVCAWRWRPPGYCIPPSGTFWDGEDYL